MTTKIALFRGAQVRRTIHNNEWYFSVVDIIEALTDSDKPRDYWYRMKQREKESSGVELSTLCRQLKLESADGKKYLTDVVTTENAFRIIQSIPSPKAEPFKRWLARVGSDAEAGGKIAGGARKQLERRLGRSIVSRKNYLRQPQQKSLN